MKEEFVPYNLALKLKELGFDEGCLAYYSKEAIYEDRDGNKTNFVLLSAKIRGELVGHGSVRNYLFQWLLDNDRTNGELHTLSESITAPLWQQVQSFLDDNGVIIGIIFVNNVFKYTLNIENYVSNGFKDRMSAIESATEYATSYLWNKKFGK